MLAQLTTSFNHYWRTTDRAQRILFISGTVLFGWMIAHLALMVGSDRPMSSPTSFRKAATFAETGWLMCWSVAYVLPHLQLRRFTKWVIVTGMLTFGLGETLLVSIQTWRNVPSHYNFATVLDSAIFSTMGGMAFYWFLTMIVLAVALLRPNSLPAPQRLAYRIGAPLMVVGGLTGYLMFFNFGGVNNGTFAESLAMVPSGDMIGRYVGQPDGTVGGNIVLLHALGVHGLNVGPFVAWLLSFTALTGAAQWRWSALASGAYLALTALFGIGAALQLPVAQMGAPLVAGVALASLMLAVAYGVAFLRGIPALLRPAIAN